MPVSFEEEKTTAPQPLSMQSRGMSGFLVRKGLAANQTSADLTLVVVAAFAIIIGGFIFFKTMGGGKEISAPAGFDPSAYERMGRAPAR